MIVTATVIQSKVVVLLPTLMTIVVMTVCDAVDVFNGVG